MRGYGPWSRTGSSNGPARDLAGQQRRTGLLKACRVWRSTAQSGDLWPAGVWSSLVFGFGGVRDFGGQLTFEPRLPRAWNELAFSLRFCGRQIRVKLTHDEERYVVEEGESLSVLIRGQSHLLSPDNPVAIKLPPP